MTATSKRRARRSPQQWKDLLAAYDARTGSAEDFCDERNVASSSIHYWRRKLAASGAPKPTAKARNTIVPIRIEAPSLCELQMPSGFVLRFPTSIDADALRSVLLALEPR